MQKIKKAETVVDPSQDPSSIGNLVINNGYLTKDDFGKLLEEFLKLRIDNLIGSFLVSKNIISREELDMLLLKQKSMRAGKVTHDTIMQAFNLAKKTQNSMHQELKDMLNFATTDIVK